MYSTTANKGTFFQHEKAKEFSTDKCVYGSFSQKVKDSKSESGFSYENWSIRFVGVACGKALALPLKEKDFIELKSWAVRNPYNKERERNEPYILCTDFDLVKDELTAENGTSNNQFNPNDFVEIVGNDGVPFD